MPEQPLKHLIAAAFICASANFSSFASADINILCSTDPDWCESKVREFSVQTGIKVNLARKATGEVFAQLKAEAANPKADVWYGGTYDPHLQAANMKDQYPWSTDLLVKSGNQVLGIYRITLGFGFNRDLLAKKKLATPTCWSDLIKPEFKGDVETSNPAISGTAHTIIATLVQ